MKHSVSRFLLAFCLEFIIFTTIVTACPYFSSLTKDELRRVLDEDQGRQKSFYPEGIAAAMSVNFFNTFVYSWQLFTLISVS